jgi:hypothetical protein
MRWARAGEASSVMLCGHSKRLSKYLRLVAIELEHKAFQAIKKWNMDLKAFSIKRKLQIVELEEWREKACHSVMLYNERTKRWHDKRIKIKYFKLGDKALLFNSHIHLFGHGMLLSHPKNFISKCEPYSSINLNFQKDFLQFKLNDLFYLFYI